MRIQIIATYHSNCWGNDCIHSCHHASNTCTFPKMHIRHGCHMWMYDWQLCQGKKLICCIFFNWYSFNPRFYRGTVLKREKEKVVRFIFCYKQSKKSCLGKYLKAGFLCFQHLPFFCTNQVPYPSLTWTNIFFSSSLGMSMLPDLPNRMIYWVLKNCNHYY